MTHIPGPWNARRWRDNRSGLRGITIVADGISLASVQWQLDDSEMANARLMAAAPELLAACEAAIKECERDCGNKWLTTQTYDQLRAAIEKAQHKGDYDFSGVRHANDH